MFHVGKLYRIQLILNSSPVSLSAMTKSNTSFSIADGDVVMLLSFNKGLWKKYNIFGILNSEGQIGEVLMRNHEMILVSRD
jgi:hypothetical protein